MRKGLKLNSIIGILLLTVLTLSFRGISLENHDNSDINTGNVTVKPEVVKSSEDLFNDQALSIYKLAGLAAAGLDYKVFLKGLTGYQNLKNLNLIPEAKAVLSVVDLSLPSTSKRLWVIDLAANKILFNTLVAHGILREKQIKFKKIFN